MSNQLIDLFESQLTQLQQYEIPQTKQLPAATSPWHLNNVCPDPTEREHNRATLSHLNTAPPVELLDWIEQQLEAGTGRAQIFRLLLEQGYPMEMAEKAMYGFKPDVKTAAIEDATLRESGKTPLSLYFGFANIRLTQDADASRIKDLRAQIYTVEKMLSPEMCQSLLHVIRDHFAPSTVVDQQGDSNNGYRTSSTAYLNQIDPDMHTKVRQRICQKMGIDTFYLEPLQVQKYEPGQEYKVHTDWFHKSSPTYRECTGEAGQRSWSCVVYLNDDFTGGGTRFTDIDKNIQPRTGMGLCWNNLSPLGVPNTYTNHCGLPVESGTKFIISAWFRENPYPAEG